MSSLTDAIRATLSEPWVSMEGLDLYRLMAVLQPRFPDYSPGELGFEIARIAVQEGCSTLIWDPPPEQGR